MAKSGDLQLVVERILRNNNVRLKESMSKDLSRIAAHLRAEGLIEKAAEDRMSVIGIAPFELATVLMDACQPSLVFWPEQKFPRFIAVLKKFVTMEKLAIEMEQEFKEASMSWYIGTFPTRLMHKWLHEEVR